MLENNSQLLPLIPPDSPFTVSLAFIPLCCINSGDDIKSQYTSPTCYLVILFTVHTTLLISFCDESGSDMVKIFRACCLPPKLI